MDLSAIHFDNRLQDAQEVLIDSNSKQIQSQQESYFSYLEQLGADLDYLFAYAYSSDMNSPDYLQTKGTQTTEDASIIRCLERRPYRNMNTIGYCMHICYAPAKQWLIGIDLVVEAVEVQESSIVLIDRGLTPWSHAVMVSKQLKSLDDNGELSGLTSASKMWNTNRPYSTTHKPIRAFPASLLQSKFLDCLQEAHVLPMVFFIAVPPLNATKLK